MSLRCRAREGKNETAMPNFHSRPRLYPPMTSRNSRKLPKVFWSGRHPSKFYYNKAARGKWHRADAVICGRNWSHDLAYGKRTPKFPPLAHPQYQAVSGKMKDIEATERDILLQKTKNNRETAEALKKASDNQNDAGMVFGFSTPLEKNHIGHGFVNPLPSGSVSLIAVSGNIDHHEMHGLSGGIPAHHDSAERHGNWTNHEGLMKIHPDRMHEDAIAFHRHEAHGTHHHGKHEHQADGIRIIFGYEKHLHVGAPMQFEGEGHSSHHSPNAGHLQKRRGHFPFHSVHIRNPKTIRRERNHGNDCIKNEKKAHSGDHGPLHIHHAYRPHHHDTHHGKEPGGPRIIFGYERHLHVGAPQQFENEHRNKAARNERPSGSANPGTGSTNKPGIHTGTKKSFSLKIISADADPLQ